MRYTILLIAAIGLFNISNAAPVKSDRLIPFDQAQKISSFSMMRRSEEEPDEDEGDEDVPPRKNEQAPAQAPAGSPAAPGTAPTVLATGAPVTGVPATGVPLTTTPGQPATQSPLESLTGTTATITTTTDGAAKGINGIAGGITKNEGLSNIETTATDVTTVAASIAAANGVGAIAGSAATSPVDGLKSTADALTKDTPVAAVLGQ